MSATPEQIEKWRAEAIAFYKTQADRPLTSYEFFLVGYLAGREAQSRKDAAEMDRLRSEVVAEQSFALNYRDSRDKARDARDIMQTRAIEAEATITQLQAQLAAVKCGEPVCTVGQILDLNTPDSLDRLPRSTPLYLAPPAAQVPDEPVAWRSRHVNYVGWTLSEWELPMREGQEQQPLYLDRRCATIPDSLHMRDVTHPKATNPEEAWMYATGWNACRAAMIEGEKKCL